MGSLVVACRPCNGRGVVPDPSCRHAIVFCAHSHYRGHIRLDVDATIAALEALLQLCAAATCARARDAGCRTSGGAPCRTHTSTVGVGREIPASGRHTTPGGSFSTT